MRILDTSVLLHWPAAEMAGGICSVSQQVELERVSPQRHMLLSAIKIDWRDVDPSWLESARQAAADSGDLPRLSNVDLDVLALTIGLSGVLYTDVIVYKM